MIPDFKNFRNGSLNFFHSAKGTTWKDHKYIKRIDGTYYYPDNYEGGRHLPDGEDSISETESNYSLSENDIEKLAREVIRGNFGNGQVRKDLLGEYYQTIQSRVNEILLGNTGSKRISSLNQESISSGEKAIEKILSSTETKGINLDIVYNVYKDKK